MRGRSDLDGPIANFREHTNQRRPRAKPMPQVRSTRSCRAVRHILAPEELDDLTPEEHHDYYRTLRVVVYAHPEGGVEVTGELMPFGASGPGSSTDDPRSSRTSMPPAAWARRSSKTPRLADRQPEGTIFAKTEEFIRNSSAIHPQFIRQLVACVLFLRAVGSKDSTERRRPGPLGERPEARRPHRPEGGSDRGYTRCADPGGPAPEEAMPRLRSDGSIRTSDKQRRTTL
jgi:hypothetical protein